MRAAILLLAFAALAHASPTTSEPLEDTAGVIAPSDETVITNRLHDLAGKGIDLAVILVRTTGTTSIESYARSRAETWSQMHGAAGVVVFAIDDRKSRIEVNDTLRLKFPDARAQTTLDNVRGFLQSADYAGAVRGTIDEVEHAWDGVAPDLESPNPTSGLPNTTTTPSTVPPGYTPYASNQTSTKSKHPFPIIPIVGGLAALLGAGALWAWASRSRSGSFSSHGVTQRPFIVDMLWCTAKIVGYIAVIVAILAVSGKSSTSSRSWGSSSRSSGGGGGGGGWSGGGASSGW